MGEEFAYRNPEDEGFVFKKPQTCQFLNFNENEIFIKLISVPQFIQEIKFLTLTDLELKECNLACPGTLGRTPH